MTEADLTTRQRWLLRQLLTGKRAADIALELGTSRSSVAQRIWVLTRRVGVRTAVQLGYWACLHGIEPSGSAK